MHLPFSLCNYLIIRRLSFLPMKKAHTPFVSTSFVRSILLYGWKKGMRSGHNINAWLFFLLWLYFYGQVSNERAVFLIVELRGKNLVSQGTDDRICSFFKKNLIFALKTVRTMFFPLKLPEKKKKKKALSSIGPGWPYYQVSLNE